VWERPDISSSSSSLSPLLSFPFDADIIAFGIGGSTVLPALRMFCLFASVGIVAIYFFQCTFFVACMSLDQRRAESARNGCCCCFTHKSRVAKKEKESDEADVVVSPSQKAFGAYAQTLIQTPAKLVVCGLALTFAAMGVWGNTLLKQEFDPIWFLPDSYASG